MTALLEITSLTSRYGRIPALGGIDLTIAEGELLALVDTTPDPTAAAAAERTRLLSQIANLVESVAKGMPADAINASSSTRLPRSRLLKATDWPVCMSTVL